MDKVFVTSDELSQVSSVPAEPTPFTPPLKPAIAWPLRLAMSVLVLLLPLLCLVAVILRVSFRNQPARTRLAWTGFTSTLLIVSGLLSTLVFVVALSIGPMPIFISGALSSFDDRQEFPQLPKVQNLTGAFSMGAWQAQFSSQSYWLYTLQRAGEFQSWTNVSPAMPGKGTNLSLQDTNPPRDKAFYRVSASRP